MALSKQERRIFDLAARLLPRLKRRKCLELRGGRWEFGTDFAKTPRLQWSYSGRRKPPFAVIPAERRILGLGPLHYRYAEKKLAEAKSRLSPRKRRQPA